MIGSGVIIRNARAEDASAMAHVEQLSWPVELAATESQFLARIAAYREGQWIAEENNRIVGVASAQRIPESVLCGNNYDHNELTDFGQFSHSHVADGEVYQLIGVGVLPEYRGMQLGRDMIDHQVAFARTLPGVRRIVGFTRPVRYHRYREIPIEEYVQRRTVTGRLLDPVLSFHLDSGAQLVAIRPNFRPEDRKACGYAVLIEYPCE